MLFSKITSSIKRRGFKRSLSIVFYKIEDYFFDFFHGIDTTRSISLKNLKITSKNIKRGVQYEPTYKSALKRLLNQISLPKDFTFVDVGSGKGRVLLLAADYGFKKNIGIEFSEKLCDIAKENINKWQKHTNNKVKIEIVQSDVLDYLMSGKENIFYFFNPFDSYVLSSFINKINDSIKNYDRPVWLIFHNMECHKKVLKNSNIFRFFNLYIFGSVEYSLYKNN
jgi:SAM-dependent methyltransferase